MQNLFQFIMVVLFGKKWLIFDLKKGYEATMAMNDMELAMHREKHEQLVLAREEMELQIKTLQERPALVETDYLAMLPDDQKESSKALYDIRKKVDGERAEEITTLKNRVSSLNQDIEMADRELQKGYALTFKNRQKYDFIKNYKPKKHYGEK